jgi:hypothetical protein
VSEWPWWRPPACGNSRSRNPGSVLQVCPNGYFVPDQCVPEKKSRGCSVPWSMRPLADASLRRCIPLSTRILVDASLRGCVPWSTRPWTIRPLVDASLGRCILVVLFGALHLTFVLRQDMQALTVTQREEGIGEQR